MGCDIHLHVEVKKNGEWISADKWEKEDDGSVSVDYDARFYSGRNYNLFAILADVRNGRGFAGIKTGDGFNPIAQPKGLPVDADPQVKECSEQWGCDGHSHSWLTVKEIMEYDWTQVSHLTGWVSSAEWARWSRYGRTHRQSPKEYCGGVSGAKVMNVSAEEMDRLLKEKPELAEAGELPTDGSLSYYALAEWDQPYYSCAENFLSETMPRLWRLGSPEDVRIVFWFDN